MSQSSPLIYDGPQTTVKLNILGLTEELLVDAVLAGEIARRSCSPLAPANAAGIEAWIHSFVRLAEELVPTDQWEKTETRGLPRMVNLETRIALAVCNGDGGTGLRWGAPKSKNPRGQQSVLFVRSNERQLNLFTEGPWVPLPPDEEQITWWLLIYSNEDEILRAELSLPVGLGEDSRFSFWRERILLDIPEPEISSIYASDDGGPPPLDIVVQPL